MGFRTGTPKPGPCKPYLHTYTLPPYKVQAFGVTDRLEGLEFRGFRVAFVLFCLLGLRFSMMLRFTVHVPGA